jgi:hypothetical protein
MGRSSAGGADVLDDAYDGGLLLIVGTETFQDPDDMEDFAPKNQSLSVGPETLEGLGVSRTDRAMATSTALRSLIKLRNPGPAQTWDIIWIRH